MARNGIKNKSLCLWENKRITAPLYLTQKGGYASSQDTESTYITPYNSYTMNRKTMRYAFVALGAGLISLASCGGQAAENQELPGARHYTPEERAKIEHTRALIQRNLPDLKIHPRPGFTEEDVLLLEGDSIVYRMVDGLRARGIEMSDVVEE